ncbi:MAG: hypothetical protein F6K53_39060 [Moorea sp. SIO4A1]|uniref:hypothetical protein n=1 Tax=Moorena sp. SIO4A1 TaxID=2607835 RepID=UPI00144FF36E|nr:hypothetical protein [Moorena sp. SIO4A1]NEQ63041.1 hypothetical protein [Moorena sp. SIO4A1]
MLKPFHPDGEAHPYQETVEQASTLFAKLFATSCQWRICHLILRLALYFWSSPAITVLACEQDLETLAVEEAL